MQMPAILDIEASGFGRGSYPIEIGFVGTDAQHIAAQVTPATAADPAA